MEPLGIWLAAVGMGDCLIGLSGEVASRVRAIWGLAASTLISALLGVGFGYRSPALVFLVCFTTLTTAAWVWSRATNELSATRASFILAGVGALTAGMVAVGAAWPTPDQSRIGVWLGNLPYEALERFSTGRFAMLLGAVLILQASGNALVRLFLRLIGNSPGSESELRGGRLIGPLERTLIFSLALLGEPTAAVLVISAKSLLRFPEINAERDKIHMVTEYFLVGSLASWALALGLAGLVATVAAA